MSSSRTVALFLLALGIACSAESDADRDGLSDHFEQALLDKFTPRFRISAADCDIAPAEFHSGLPDPKVKARNGTIYGQVFPAPRAGESAGFVEVHFYHLWAQDCGVTGHALDAEFVSALLRADSPQSPLHDWYAVFWYGAAHEGTLCDMGNGATAAALSAIDRGPDVWVSRNKHASFLSRELCAQGCGGDVCDGANAMRVSQVVNLGEPGAPMNGTFWSASPAWPLASKMTPRYTSTLIARMPSGPEVEIVPARNPLRGAHTTIKVAGRTYRSLALADARTGAAAAEGTAGADAGLGAASDAVTTSAQHSYRSLRAASSAVGRFLRRARQVVAPPPDPGL